MKTHKIVKVEWDDSASYSGWRNDNKEFEVEKCTSCGVLVKTKRGSIGIAHSIGGDQVNGTMVIPRKAITKIEVLSTFKK